MRKLDLLGKTFGKLKVIDIDAESTEKIFWICQCTCGNVKSVCASSLTKKDNPTRSCGCNRIKKIVNIGDRFGKLVVIEKSPSSNNVWKCRCDCGNMISIKGYELIHTRSVCSRGCANKTNFGEAAFNSVYNDSKRSANKRGYAWKISKDEFREITSQSCFYCGQYPETKTNRMDLNGDYIHNGIDRVDNTRGYVINNVVPCCWNCNRAKQALSAKDFRSWVLRVHRHWASH